MRLQKQESLYVPRRSLRHLAKELDVKTKASESDDGGRPSIAAPVHAPLCVVSEDPTMTDHPADNVNQVETPPYGAAGPYDFATFNTNSALFTNPAGYPANFASMSHVQNMDIYDQYPVARSPSETSQSSGPLTPPESVMWTPPPYPPQMCAPFDQGLEGYPFPQQPFPVDPRQFVFGATSEHLHLIAGPSLAVQFIGQDPGSIGEMLARVDPQPAISDADELAPRYGQFEVDPSGLYGDRLYCYIQTDGTPGTYYFHPME